jgi:hypothetical protein
VKARFIFRDLIYRVVKSKIVYSQATSKKKKYIYIKDQMVQK